MAKKYNIGLDIGTNSVGWAVVEKDTQKIIRKGKGKNIKRLWGVRLFEKATTAEERRNFRSTRRRYDRRRERIRLLQEEFSTEINNVDVNFYQKLKESFFNEIDINNKKIILTKKEKEEIKEYQNKYKTIYHLRNELLNSNEKFDIRLIYLVIHHIIKYRGNFLYSNSNFNINNLNLKEKLISCFKTADIHYESIDYDSLSDALLNPSKNDRKIIIKQCLDKDLEKNFIGEFTKLINGNKFNFSKMLNLEIEEKIELSFNGNEYDDKYDELCSIIDDEMDKLQIFKELYDMIFLKRLFKNSSSTSISSLMVEKYNIHKEHLKFLKNLFKSNKILYNRLFKSTTTNICLYERYIKNNISYDEFIKEINKMIENLTNNSIETVIANKYTTKIKGIIDNGEFLPRITDTDNGKYPYQLNKEELIKIIENQGKYYPFLLNKMDCGKYKLVQLLEFKIPYYIGPLVSEDKSQFAWMSRKINKIKITPYNFDQVIDKEETAEKFIKRMLGHCTYLLNEYAMPNNSILYSKYKVLNELKQIKINGNKIDNDLQQMIIKDLFMKKSGTITDKIFKEYISYSSNFPMYTDDFIITGYSSDNKFANNMQSHIDFFGENGIFIGTNYTEDDADKIIELITIFDDKEMLIQKVKKLFPELKEEQLKKISLKKYKGWGSLSKELLTKKYYKDKRTGNMKSILDLMYETDANFMQILNNDEYKFQDMIKEYNKIHDEGKFSYKYIENLATSPANKRGIYQALKIIEEIINYMKYEPESIIIEMARGSEKKKRKDDKKHSLIKLYENSKNTIDNYKVLFNELNYQEKIDSQKLFLYFIQEGKSLYSGTPLDINDLAQYEIDHIIPRTLIKDDSIENKALVLREENQSKSANYVLPSNYRNDKNKKWWEHLKKIGLMSAKKYHNLIRREYKQDDIEGFINRQIVETRQIAKHVANIISNNYKNTKVIYLSANLSHNYREKYELYKFREINDYHHAHDAYLAAVLGEYKEKYLKKIINFDELKELNARLINNKEYDKLQYGYVINSLDSLVNNELNELTNIYVDNNTGEIIFDANEFNKRIEYNLYCNDILISKKIEFKSGEFYNQTKNKKGNKGVWLKKGLPTELYGSYSSLNPAYAIMVRYTKKDKTNQRLIGIPIYYTKKTNKKFLADYIKKILNISTKDTVKFISNPIPFYTELNWQNQKCSLVGATNTVEICNSKQLKVDKKSMIKYKKMLSRLLNNKKNKIDDDNYSISLSDFIHYLIYKIEREYILYNNLVPELKNILSKDNIRIFDIEAKEKTIIQLLNLLKYNSMTANFKFLNSNYSMAFGKKHNKIIQDVEVINKSVTGIYERKKYYEF